LALALGHEQIAQQLVHYGASLDAVDEEGDTALHIACAKSLQFVKELVENGADVNSQNALGHTPLHVASSAQNSAVVEYLLKNGSREDTMDKFGLYPANYFHSKKSPSDTQLMSTHCAPLGFLFPSPTAVPFFV